MDTEGIAQIAMEWYEAREKRRQAKAALKRYREEHGSCAQPGCIVCKGATPLYRAYKAAASSVAGKLRRLIRICEQAQGGDGNGHSA